jgi:hypothetical protein
LSSLVRMQRCFSLHASCLRQARHHGCFVPYVAAYRDIMDGTAGSNLYAIGQFSVTMMLA